MTSIRLAIAVLLLTLGGTQTFAANAVAIADPSNLVPVCTGNQTPQTRNCRTACPEGAPINPTTTGCTEPGTIAVSGGPADQLPHTAAGPDPAIPFGVAPNNIVGGSG